MHLMWLLQLFCLQSPRKVELSLDCRRFWGLVGTVVPSPRNFPGNSIWENWASHSNSSSLVDTDLGLQDLLLRFQYSNTHTHGLQRSCGGTGTVVTLSRGEHPCPQPLPWQAFIVFLGPLHQRRSSFTMQRFVLGGYLLQTREKVSLNTSKEDICNVKGEVVQSARFQT